MQKLTLLMLEFRMLSLLFMFILITVEMLCASCSLTWNGCCNLYLEATLMNLCGLMSECLYTSTSSDL